MRDALVQGGRLGISSDPVLRERLAAWPGYYEEVLDDRVLGRDFVSERLRPHMATLGIPFGSVIQPEGDGRAHDPR